MQKDYWEQYYKISGQNKSPSLFAQFALEKYLNPGDSLVELGCGNGRDAAYFAHNSLNVLAIDQCEMEITSLSKLNIQKNLVYQVGDFTKLGNLGLFKDVYSRFTLHSVNEQGEDSVVAWAYNYLSLGGTFLIEARGLKNELYGRGEKVAGEEHSYIYDNHYRRFIDINNLVSKLTKQGFKIILSEEAKDFAPLGDSNQVFIRVIAIK